MGSGDNPSMTNVALATRQPLRAPAVLRRRIAIAAFGIGLCMLAVERQALRHVWWMLRQS